MSDTGAFFALLLVAAIAVFSAVSCSHQASACKAAGGTPVYEYKNMPSCWSADGRRMFP